MDWLWHGTPLLPPWVRSLPGARAWLAARRPGCSPRTFPRISGLAWPLTRRLGSQAYSTWIQDDARTVLHIQVFEIPSASEISSCRLCRFLRVAPNGCSLPRFPSTQEHTDGYEVVLVVVVVPAAPSVSCQIRFGEQTAWRSRSFLLYPMYCKLKRLGSSLL